MKLIKTSLTFLVVLETLLFNTSCSKKDNYRMHLEGNNCHFRNKDDHECRSIDDVIKVNSRVSYKIIADNGYFLKSDFDVLIGGNKGLLDVDYSIDFNTDNSAMFTLFNCKDDTNVKVSTELESFSFIYPYSKDDEVGFEYKGNLNHINWGDGTSYDSINSVHKFRVNLPNYEYVVHVSGQISEFTFVDSTRHFIKNGNALIKKINIRSSVSTIPTNAFRNMTNLEDVSLSNSIINIKENSFSNCNTLKNISLPTSLNYIGNDAFNSCINLNKIILYDSIESIGSDAFKDCNKLTIFAVPEVRKTNWDINFNSSNRPIYYGYIKDGTSGSLNYIISSSNKNQYATIISCNSNTVSEIEIPSTIEIANANIPVTSIGTNAFKGKRNLKSVIIPTSIVNIGKDAFKDCLLNIYTPLHDKQSGWDKDFNPDSLAIYYSYVKKFTVNCFNYVICNSSKPHAIITNYIYRQDYKNAIVPREITFEGIRYSVDSIGTNAFNNCIGLKSIILKDNIKYIHANAFLNAPYKLVIICEKISSAYSGWDKDFNPDNIPIYFNLESQQGLILEDDYTAIVKKENDNYYATLVKYEFEQSVYVSVPSSIYVEHLHKKIPVTAIGSRFFHPGSSNGFFGIPSSVSKIYDYAFINSNLQSFSFNKETTNLTIGKGIFKGCKKLKNIDIPTSINLENGLPEETFMDCVALQNVTLESNSNIKVICKKCFYNCSSLQNFKFLSTIETIETYAFYNCNSITLVEFPENLTVIKENSFMLCNNIAKISFKGTNVTNISDYAFASCTKLNYFDLTNQNKLINAGLYIFDKHSEYFTIYFSNSNLMNDYQKANNWSQYKNCMCVI